MNFAEFAPLALRTAKPLNAKDQSAHSFLGFLGELGELADTLKRWHIYKQPLNRENAVEECGDILWFIAYYADIRGYKKDSLYGNFDKVAQVVDTLNTTPYQHQAMYGALISANDWFMKLFLEGDDTYGRVLAGLYYDILIMLKHLESSQDEAFNACLNKLSKRYPEGYTDWHALEREDKKVLLN